MANKSINVKDIKEFKLATRKVEEIATVKVESLKRPQPLSKANMPKLAPVAGKDFLDKMAQPAQLNMPQVQPVDGKGYMDDSPKKLNAAQIAALKKLKESKGI